MTTDETHTTPKSKGKEPLYTSDDDTANEEHGTPTVNADRDVDGVVEGLNALTVTKKATPTMTSKETYLRNYWKGIKDGLSAYHARGAVDTNQYIRLMKLRKYKECPYGTDQPDLRKAWFDFVKNFPPMPKSDEYYLKEFGKAYTKNPDLNKARGAGGLYKFCALKKIVDEDLKFPELKEYELLLKRVWTYEETPFMERSALTHLVDFHESYQKDGDFETARGKHGCARYQALKKLNSVTDLSTYDEPYQSKIRKLQEVWERNKTWKEHLEDFHESYQKDSDFKKARGTHRSARYFTLLKLTKVQDLSTYEETYRSKIKFLQEVWKEHLVIEKNICLDGDDTIDSTYAFVKNLTSSKPSKLRMNMNGLWCGPAGDEDHMAWLNEFFSVCDECVDAGWDVEVLYKVRAYPIESWYIGMYKNKTKSNLIPIDGQDCKGYTKEEQDEFTKHYMSGYDDDTWTVEGKARLRQLCLSTLEYCTELNWDCPVRQMVLALQECPPLSDAETELSQYSDDEV